MCHALLLPILCLSSNASRAEAPFVATNQSNASNASAAAATPLQLAESAGLLLQLADAPGLVQFRVVAFAHGPDAWWLGLFLAVCVFSGVVIGAVGPGGVLIVPAAVMLDVPIATAGAAAVASFALGGLATLVTQRRLLPAAKARLLCPGAVPGALAGASLFPLLPPLAVSVGVATFAVASGAHLARRNAPCSAESAAQQRAAWRRSAWRRAAKAAVRPADAAAPPPKAPPPPPPERHPAKFHLALGALIGLLSQLTATGGPAIALPLFFHFFPRHSAASLIALAQALTIPNGLAAMVVAATRDEGFDVALAASIGAATAAGVPVGAYVARRLPERRLKLLCALMLVMVGAAAIAKEAEKGVRAAGLF